MPCKRRQKNDFTDLIVYNFDNKLPKQKIYVVCFNYYISNSQTVKKNIYSGKPCLVDFTAPPNGNLSEPTGSVVPHASDVIITCGSGYVVKGESKYSCDDGTFPLLEQTECVYKGLYEL